MTEQELGWVAGLLEGEGSFFVTTDNYKGATYYKGTVALGMTDEDVVRKFCRIVGCGKVNGPYNREDPTHKPIWRWQVSKRFDALRLMSTVRPLMGERRAAKIDEVISVVEKHARTIR